MRNHTSSRDNIIKYLDGYIPKRHPLPCTYTFSMDIVTAAKIFGHKAIDCRAYIRRIGMGNSKRSKANNGFTYIKKNINLDKNAYAPLLDIT